ncbi:MAG: metal-sensitive transcriptional regulator [Roseiflexus sp.]|nr:metal-sensitive transcriptional regulator [Roseiflexus sp.]MCS7291021.1 metal-sensitive transcriptional regulator [Roseiflexus sp.]MDW8147483.1 metal-sensitive transcriptional regulator [Roseiflexaceae bacterium]MDW8233425.1 metal-sensitive transcriptional regulator [Roseiflexaceae bacterium]
MSALRPSRPISDELRHDVLVRLRRIEGQVRGIQRMIEECRDCQEIVTQLAAVKAAIGSLSTLLAETYARDCLCCGEAVNAEEVARLLDVLKSAR